MDDTVWLPVADEYKVVVSTPVADVFVFWPQETLPLTVEEIAHDDVSLPSPSYSVCTCLLFSPARKWSHYSFLLVVGCWILLLFSLLYRFRLVPRVLAALGMIAAVLQIAGVSLRGLLGYPPETRLAMPLAPAYVLLAVWLMVKGFDERRRPLSADADGASAGPTQ